VNRLYRIINNTFLYDILYNHLHVIIHDKNLSTDWISCFGWSFIFLAKNLVGLKYFKCDLGCREVLLYIDHVAECPNK